MIIFNRLFPKKTQFQYGEAADEFTCIEMQQGLPWTTQVDLFALASVIHFMLFGCYMTYEKHQESWRQCISPKTMLTSEAEDRSHPQVIARE